jgi:hypothetical protein
MSPPNKCGTVNNTRDNIHHVSGLDISSLSATLTVKCGREDKEANIQNLAPPANFAGSFNFTPPRGALIEFVNDASAPAGKLSVRLNGVSARIVGDEITARNGLIYPIDKVLWPPE